MADDFPDFVKFEGFAGQAWYHQHMREKRILRRAREFTPERLLEKGEQGVWYDPSDTTTLFQDSAGTTPVTASGQPVGLMLDKSGRGHHATQPTAASRPIYRRGDSRGVVNLLTWSEGFGDATWARERITVTSNFATSPTGSLTAERITEDTTPTSTHRIGVVTTSLLSSATYTVTCSVKAAGRTSFYIQDGGAKGTNNRTFFDLSTQAITKAAHASHVSASMVDEGGGWFRVTLTYQIPVAATLITWLFGLALGLSPDYTGDGTSGIYIWGAQLNLGPTALPYQRNDSHLGGVATGASTDLHWLETDGVDDGMVTGSIDFTGTDKVAVFAGVRKLSDAGLGIVAELSISTDSSNGTFFMASGRFAGANMNMRSRGTVVSDAISASTFPSPFTAVMTGTGDIQGDSTTLRINGAQAAQRATDQGTGSFGNYPLYLFRRGGTTLPFNGWFYGMAITGRLTTDAETAATERFLAAKSAVVIP